MKTCAITGHTRGIGKAISVALPPSYKIVGLSRSNGYDICQDQEKICTEVSEHDVFINNAFHHTAQTEIFEKLYDSWKTDNTKTIVNINSRAKYLPTENNSYAESKLSLNQVVNEKLFRSDRQCRIINISPGYVLTESNKDYLESRRFNYITSESLADYVVWAIEQPVEIWQLDLWKTNIWKN